MNRGYRNRYNGANMDNMDENVFENSSCNCIDNMYTEKDACECGFGETFNSLPHDPMLGQSYVPWQIMNKTFTPEMGLKMGSMFPELVFPYVPNQSKDEKDYLKEKNEIKGGCNNECRM